MLKMAAKFCIPTSAKTRKIACAPRKEPALGSAC